MCRHFIGTCEKNEDDCYAHKWGKVGAASGLAMLIALKGFPMWPRVRVKFTRFAHVLLMLEPEIPSPIDARSDIFLRRSLSCGRVVWCGERFGGDPLGDSLRDPLGSREGISQVIPGDPSGGTPRQSRVGRLGG